MFNENENYRFTCAERLLRYAKYDTQSDPGSKAFPSTEKQKALSAELAKELKAIGLADARMDKWGYVFATLPSNSDKDVPAIAFIGHVDTSAQVSGKNVKPAVHKNYRGGDIRLENGLAIKVEESPDLERMIGYDIVTSDGTTLLGADDKAGVAEIVDAMNYLSKHLEVKHGTVKVCFTPDEETGRGTEKLDVNELGARYGYTVDAKGRGEVEAETFSADFMTFKFYGISIHPGDAKDRMVNSIKVAAAFIDSLPKSGLSPETTSGREGFVHCTAFDGKEELTTVEFIVRDFATSKLMEYEALLEGLAR
jgi:tripeptide aminopeptidase